MNGFAQRKSAGIKTVLCLALFWVLAVPFGGALVASTSTSAKAATVSSISVRGNRRVDAETVRSYVQVQPGRNYSSFDVDESLAALYATGLFSDVRISRSGRTLVVQVEENPTINLVRFEGEDKVKEEQLERIVQSKSLGIFNQDTLDSDVERIKGAVLRSGRASARVTARVDQLENNRVDIVFLINEGARTKISDITFVGNNAFSDRRLTEVISHNESNFLSWLKRDDLFDPDRLQADEERLRQFYYNRGYADFQVLSASGDFDEVNNSYSISITVDEGELYRFGNVQIDNALEQVPNEALERALEFRTGDVYSAREVERSLIELTEVVARTGYSFGEVTPRGDRNFENRTIDITFFVDEGPRTYIERIEVSGNTRTREYVVRREFDISEGDAYNRVYVNQAKRRLEALGFFERVRITTRPGSSPDRVVLVVNVQDKPTGDFSIGGGYSTNSGAIAEISLTERNFLGRGQYLRISGGYGEDVTRYKLSFTEPYFLGNRIAVGFDLSREEAEGTNGAFFDTTTTLGRLRASAPVTENLTAGVNYTFVREENEPTSDQTLTRNQYAATIAPALADTFIRSPYDTSSLGYTLTYADIDSMKNPREGIYGTFSQDFAGVGGDASYVKSVAKLTGYYLLSEDADLVLKGTLSGGHIQAFGSDNLRVSDHFYIGGETIRGFEPRGIGPRITAVGTQADGVTPLLGINTAVGGTSYVAASVEAQFPLPLISQSFGLRGALFADAGTLVNNDYGGYGITDDSDLRASVGASVIWDSPFGPLRADFAHPVAKNDYDETQFFRFGISTKF